ncbi:MAG: substrate-binding domain-containing protein, partial [Armatimonadetes bacterium]|nr:substrate-binding domain-containing protein [Anaerolineae bacterium]
MRKITLGGVFALLLLSLSLTTAAAQSRSILETLISTDDFSIFADLVAASGAEAEFSGNVTVFAPANAAFDTIPTFVLDYLKSDNPELLGRVVRYHIASGGARTLAQVIAQDTLPTVEGTPLTVEGALNRVNATIITQADIAASDGVLHAIGGLLVPPIDLPDANPSQASGNISAGGSSTVAPITARMTERFNQAGFRDTVENAVIGTGGGFDRLCADASSDIANASRPINAGEIAECQAQGREPIAFQVGIDALAVTVSDSNRFLTGLSMDQLAAVFSGGAVTWAELDPAWSNNVILPFSPGTDSGTFDYFVEEVFESDPVPMLSVPGIAFSESDTTL